MRLAVSGVELDEGEEPRELAAAARAAGATGVELWHDRNTSALGVDRTIAVLAEAGLAFSCVTSQIELYVPAGVEEAQRALCETIELAARVGAPFANSYFGFAAVRDDAAAVAAYAAAVRPCVERAEALGVTLLLENEFNAFGLDPSRSDLTREPERVLALFEAVDSPAFGMTFDPTNFTFAGVEDHQRAYEVLADVIRYVHVKNGHQIAPGAAPRPGWSRYTDYDDEYTTAPLDEGAVDWPALLARLRADGYDGWLCVEPHGARDELLPHCEEAAAFVREQVGIRR